MAFKFNFGASEEPAPPSKVLPLRRGRLVEISESHNDFSKEDEEEVVTPDGHCMKKYRLRSHHLSRFPELKHVTQQSDLEPSIYEGGFKLWECCLDLIDWLAKHEIDMNGLRVLELGCGHGLPGIWCLSKGAIVDFADYNEEVLRVLTIPNVQRSAPEALSRCRFIAGDWALLADIIHSSMYDLILCSEVLYFVTSYEKLVQLLQRSLKKSGKILIASKVYYFSCGGGTRQFEEQVTRAGVLKCQVLKRIEDQQSNIREILQLEFKS